MDVGERPTAEPRATGAEMRAMNGTFAEQMTSVARIRADVSARGLMTADVAGWLDAAERAIDNAWREAEAASREQVGRGARRGR